MNNKISNKENEKFFSFESREYYGFIKLVFRNIYKILISSTLLVVLSFYLVSNYIIQEKQNVSINLAEISTYEEIKYNILNNEFARNNLYVPPINSKTLLNLFSKILQDEIHNLKLTKLYLKNKNIDNTQLKLKYLNFIKSASYETLISDFDNSRFLSINMNENSNSLNVEELKELLSFLINTVNSSVKKQLINEIKFLKSTISHNNKMMTIKLNNEIANKLNIYEEEMIVELARLKEMADIALITDSTLGLVKDYPNINFDITQDNYIEGYNSIVKRMQIIEERSKNQNFHAFANISNEKSSLEKIKNDPTLELFNLAMKKSPLSINSNEFNAINFNIDSISINKISNYDKYLILFVLSISSIFLCILFFVTRDGYIRFSKFNNN